jgi:hypothetical protein
MSSPPCTMPNKAAPARASFSNAFLLRSAQRSDNCIARSISARGAGSFRHSSSCITMSEPSSPWISMERSGVSSNIAPSMCERNVTAFSVSFRNGDSDITWKPPESVRIGRSQFMNLCSPPSSATRSAPGRSIR